MKRRSKVSGKRAERRRPNASKFKRRSASKHATRATPPAAGEQRETARLASELNEAREQQAATAGVLRMISHFPSDVQSVLEAIVRVAGELCEAEYAILFRFQEGKYHVACSNNAAAEFVRYFAKNPISVNEESLVGRTALARRAVHIEDCLADPEYKLHVAGRLGRHRTLLGVPLLHEGEAVGVIGLLRTAVKPFTEKQVELVTTFADQAVIAIENARLLNELREAMEQQTAASEVLQVISGSPGDLQPVFDRLLRNATRLCKAKFGTLFLREEAGLRLVAAHDMPEAFSKAYGTTAADFPPGGALSGAIRTKHPVQITDLAATTEYELRHPKVVEAVELGGIRTALSVPMLKDDVPIGVIAIHRPEVLPFNEKQIALLASFGAQAVIAIENARLLNELRQSLEQQTATAQVLQVISTSTGDLAHVFATMLGNATRICEAKFGTLYLKEGDGFRAMATHNAPLAYEEARAQIVHPSPHTTLWRAANTKRAVQIADVTLERGYLEGEPFVVSAVKMGGYRSVLSVPMLHEHQVVGVITIFRQEVSSFGDEHISLLQNFAAQAVIAIENARLLNDLRDRTQQLQAQSEELAQLNEQLEQRVADQVGEIERMSRLRRFLPPQVADLIVASGSEKQLESHRREITALFCDLRGFTGFTESADAEDVMALLRDYHAAIGEIIIKYNGTLERYAGDGVMVVFNDPVPVENPALQAVLMALEVRDAIGALTETWRRWGHDIGFGIGIAHGFATLGTIGFEGRFDYAAIGTVSNVASRLCDEAKPGQILISPRVLTKVEDAVKVEPVGEFELKGIRRPLAAYNVVGAL
jgi:GAF domain-containing protein